MKRALVIYFSDWLAVYVDGQLVHEGHEIESGADFEGMRKGGGSVVAYAWYVWEKVYQGPTQLKWIN